MKQTDTKSTQFPSRPPVVAVLGHVDHGKTTLLDTIRKSNTADKEAGAITQRIGAYQIIFSNKKITFIDTPGHEAFSQMRLRGARVSDFAVLVVAANDGVMPQTIESISAIKKAGIPLIVAINKIDLPESNTDRIKQQLAQHDVLVEGYGGQTVVVELSAKTGKGIDQLLEVILLLSEMQGISADPKGPFLGVVIEAKKDQKRGILVTVIVQSGTLSVGNDLFTDTAEGRVRALFDEYEKPVIQASPGKPVEILGFKSLPAVGSTVASIKNEKPIEHKAKPILSPEEFLLAATRQKHLKLIIRADSAGSLEAIKENIAKDVDIINAEVGEITESDIVMAEAGKAVIVGFNTKVSSTVSRLAQEEGVRIKTYSIIYDLLTEISEVITILKNPESQETVLGTGVIVDEFPFEDMRIAGCRITEGRVARGDTIKLMRDTLEVARTKIRSLQQGRQKVDKVEAGSECGILLDKKLDFKIKDSIIAYKNRGVL